MSGPRWLAIDADMFAKPFIRDLYAEFGWAGIGTWVAFLCACKRSRTPGRIRIANDIQAMSELGILDLDLVNAKGEPWTMSEFWAFTGRKKQTRRVPVGRRDARATATGQCFDVDATHWQRWQDDARMQRKAEQMRTSRAQKRGTGLPRDRHAAGTNVVSDNDIYNPPTPLKGGNGQVVESQKRTANCTTCFVAPCVCPDEPALPADQAAQRAAQLRNPG